jgi:hypothetical protein
MLTEQRLQLFFKFGIILNLLLFKFLITVVVKCQNIVLILAP